MKNLIIKARTLNGCKCYNYGEFVGRTRPIITKAFGRTEYWTAEDATGKLIGTAATGTEAGRLVFANNEARKADRRAAYRSLYGI